jgi:hypothetical protein
MQKPKESSCIRCGKTRVVSKVWQEYLGQSLVTYTDTVCPDPECQKIVEEEIIARREKKELVISERRTKAKQIRDKLSTLKPAA